MFYFQVFENYYCRSTRTLINLLGMHFLKTSLSVSVLTGFGLIAVQTTSSRLIKYFCTVPIEIRHVEQMPESAIWPWVYAAS